MKAQKNINRKNCACLKVNPDPETGETWLGEKRPHVTC